MLKMSDIQSVVAPIAQRYRVSRVDIFGSYADGRPTAGSDVDFLVEFSYPSPSIFKVMGFREELRRALGVDVDVVTLPIPNPEYITIGKRERVL